MQSILRKLTTWLVLVAYLITGVLPRQQLVLRLEPDGSVVLEVAGENNCTPSEWTDESTKEFERLPSDCCPCIDILLPTQDESPQAKQSSGDVFDSLSVVAPRSHFATVTRFELARHARPAHTPPRPAERLALIRTVILRV